jgi:CheY-like chemotaxis protein/HPt (histidine-containing phosphotransfer) domain-containing protein
LQALCQALDAGTPFDLAILDMQMPGMDGATLARAIRADPRLSGLVLVVMTSLGQHGYAQNRLKEIGVAASLTKPVRQVELFACLASVLAGGARPSLAPRGPGAAPEAVRTGIRRGARILLAEDNITNQQVATGILNKFGLKTDTVANGQEALVALRDMPYDLVLMDVQMPVMDGLEATRQIRNPQSALRNHQIPVIAMTAHAMAGDRDLCLQAGMNDYVSKPVDPQSLAKVLAKWLPEAPSGIPGESPASPSQPPAPAAGTPAAPAVAVFDRAGLLARLMDDENLLRIVQESFLNEVPQDIEVLQKLVARGEAKLAGMQAHKIKGAAANVGAEALREVAAAMEKAGKEGNAIVLPQHLRELQQRFDQLRRVMETNGTEAT